MTDETTNALRAVAHPVRLQMLSLLTGTELSAAEVARELGITHANASYHLRTLLDAGELVIASEEKIRGGVAKRYRHPWQRATRSGSRARVGTLEDRTLYVRVMAEELRPPLAAVGGRHPLALHRRRALGLPRGLRRGDGPIHAASMAAARRREAAAHRGHRSGSTCTTAAVRMEQDR